jgi:predicted enzyme related to lactoylglutathione lyase
MARGEVTHIEFPADDVDRAKAFYGAVAGWEFGEAMPGYWMFRTGPEAGGAVGKRGESIAEKVRVYITVDSLEEAVATTEAHGGKVIEPPTDIGGDNGRFAVIIDSEGNEVGLWQSTAG